MYGKLINGVILFAKRLIRDGERIIDHPTPEQLIELGYLPIVFSKQPIALDGYCYVETWTEINGEIVQGWELVEEPTEPTADEILDILTGEDE